MEYEPRICQLCGISFVPPYKVTRAYWAGRRFCSSDCAHRGMQGEQRSTRGVRRLSLTECFWSKVDKRTDDECWEWSGSCDGGGYGVLVLGRSKPRTQKAHRYSWELQNGPILDVLAVCHHCDNPPCVNPNHLFLGTRGDNNRDRSSKGRGRENRQHGEANRQAKLSTDQVREIRQLVASGLTQLAVAEEYGIKQPQVSRIVRGVSWRV